MYVAIIYFIVSFISFILFFVTANYETINSDMNDIFPPKKSSQYETFVKNYHEQAVPTMTPSSEQIDLYIKSVNRSFIDKIQALYKQDFYYFGYPMI